MAKKPITKKASIAPQEGKQTLAFTTKVDFMIYGGARGAGKSELLAMRPLPYITDPAFRGIFFRRQYGELTGEGGLWQKAEKMYPEFGGKSNTSNLRFKFPTGAGIRFSHMYHEKDKESHRGLQYSFIGLDEIDQFSKSQVQFLLTCLRSEADMDSFCIGTCNPNPDSWVLNIVEWYLDETGIPDPEKCGVVRYYIVLDGEFVFGDSEDFFKENYPDSVFVYNPLTGGKIYIPPKTFTFIAGNVFDNPALLQSNPRYLSELQNLEPHERDRQLWGSWYARAKGSNSFERNWLINCDKVPEDAVCCRSYDMAYTQPSDINRYPDYTASVKWYKCSQGYYYLCGDYLPDFKDEGEEIIGRVRKRAGERDTLMMAQANLDSEDCIIVIPKDPAGGQVAYETMAKTFTEAGFRIDADPMPSNKSKLTRFQPFATAAQNGLIRVVRDSFPNKKTLDKLLAELEAFDGERSTASKKDDWADATASGFNYMATKIRVRKPIPIPQINSPTRLVEYRK